MKYNIEQLKKQLELEKTKHPYVYTDKIKTLEELITLHKYMPVMHL
jgi:hypothetical protein